MSKTGNTKKVAEAIYDEIKGDKEIRRVEKVKDLEGYDLAFLGFPIHAYGPDKKARRFLESQTEGKEIALFITHASPEDHEELPGYLAKFEDAVEGATLVGMFNCQGELGRGVKFLMSVQPDQKVRHWAKIDDSQGQPDATRLERARLFARETMEKARPL